MTVITVEQFVPRPRDEVFALLDDFGSIYRFNPVVETSPVPDGAKATGLGAERTCHFYDGNHIKERVTEHVPGERLVVDIYQGSMPLRHAIATFTLADAPNGTLVTMQMDYALKGGVLGKVMDAVMVRRQFAANLAGLLAGLDAHMQTGDEVGKDYFKARAAVA